MRGKLETGTSVTSSYVSPPVASAMRITNSPSELSGKRGTPLPATCENSVMPVDSGVTMPALNGNRLATIRRSGFGSVDMPEPSIAYQVWG